MKELCKTFQFSVSYVSIKKKTHMIETNLSLPPQKYPESEH